MRRSSYAKCNREPAACESTQLVVLGSRRPQRQRRSRSWARLLCGCSRAAAPCRQAPLSTCTCGTGSTGPQSASGRVERRLAALRLQRRALRISSTSAKFGASLVFYWRKRKISTFLALSLLVCVQWGLRSALCSLRHSPTGALWTPCGLRFEVCAVRPSPTGALWRQCGARRAQTAERRAQGARSPDINLLSTFLFPLF